MIGFPESQFTNEKEEVLPSIDDILALFKNKALAERQRVRYEKATNKDEILKDIIEIAESEQDIVKERFEEIKTEDDLLDEKLISQRDAIMEVVQEAILNKEKFESLGRGNVAIVGKSEIHPKYCYKIIHNPEGYKKENNVVKETDIMESAIAINDSEMVIPDPVYRLANRKTHLYVMETIDGCSLEDLFLDKNNDILEKFNPDTFFPELQKGLDSLHKGGVHHRDLHVGNVMIQRETGKPCLIDFGKSVIIKDAQDDDSAYFQEVERFGVVGTQSWLKDNDEFITIKNDIRKALEKTSTKG